MITRRLARPLSAWTSSSLSSWTCPACIRSSTFPKITQTPINTLTPLSSQREQRRTITATPRRNERELYRQLDYNDIFKGDGVPGLLSPTGYFLAWTQYQTMMAQKLRELTAGDALEGKDPKVVLLDTARDPMNASLFNHASMLFNNHFFFSTLSTSPVSLEADSTAALRRSLETTFGSIDTLRATMLDTAQAMFGPGFVWLVWAQDVPGPDGLTSRSGFPLSQGDWRILTTYLAGTPYPEAGYRLQDRDMSTEADPSLSGRAGDGYQPLKRGGIFGSSGEPIPPGSTRISPALCVNTWEHVYIYDFGLPGKRKYLSDWWDAVDWDAVEGNVHGFAWKRSNDSQR